MRCVRYDHIRLGGLVSITVIRVFVPFALGYLLSYLLRVVNVVIAPSLIEDLGLSASDLGLLTSANLFAFAAFQIPLGVLLDRYGPRKTESVLLIIAAIGTAMFAMAGSLAMLTLGRALIRLGTSALCESIVLACGTALRDIASSFPWHSKPLVRPLVL